MLTCTSSLPSIAYGVDTQGIAPTPLAHLRSTIARTVAPDTFGRHIDASFTALEAKGSLVDPVHSTVGLVLYRWAMAVFEQWLPYATLAAAWAKYLETRLSAAAARRSPWYKVAGPTAATVESAVLLGWSMPDPFSFRTDTGTLWSLRSDSPAALRGALRSASVA